MTKQKSTKRALLLSALSLLMCVSMLIGSTFAWFTDSVTSGSNIIKSGTLDVALVDATGESLEGEMIEWAAKDGRAQEDILWEPGCTYNTEEFYIENKGNLNLKFKFAVTGIDGDAKLLEVIDFSVMADASQMHFNTGAVSVGTSGTFDLLKGYEVDTLFYGKQTFTEYVLEPGDKVGPLVLSGHMDENAGNKYQNLTIEGIAVSIIATQATGEEDSFNGVYDAEAGVITVTPENVQDALNNAADNTVIQLTAGNYGVLTLAPVEGGETTVLDSTTGYLSRTINGLTIKGVDSAKVDGIRVSAENGNTISLNNIVIDGIEFTGVADGFACTINGTPLKNFTMQNCKMVDGGNKNLVILRTPENVTITNCEVDGAARLLSSGTSKNVTVTNNTIKNATEHGILLNNNYAGNHSGTVVISDNDFYGNGTNARFIRFANMDDAKLIITNNDVYGYKAANGSERDYIKITYNNSTVEPDVTIYGNRYEYTVAGESARLWISVNGEEYVQATPDKITNS